MLPQNIVHMLNFTYEKSSEEIVRACTKKIEALLAKVREREERIANLRKEYGINDAALIQLLTQARKQQGNNAGMTYSFSNGIPSPRDRDGGKMTEETITIGAGVVNNLLTENDFIESEKSQADKLAIIVRNLKDLPNDNGDKRGHRLSYDELVYLGF